MTVGERIEQKRKEHNLSMEALGEMLGVGKSAINKWEKGYVQRISRPMIIKMAKIFDCDPAWLGGYITEEEERSKQIRDLYTFIDDETLEKAENDPQLMEFIQLFLNTSEENRPAVLQILKGLQRKP